MPDFIGAPDTIRTCDLCLRRANVHAPNPGTTHLINRKNGCCKPPDNHAQRATLLRATLPCETALWLFHDVDRRRKLKGWARTG